MDNYKWRSKFSSITLSKLLNRSRKRIPKLGESWHNSKSWKENLQSYSLQLVVQRVSSGWLYHQPKWFLDRKHELTNLKRDWHPAGPDGGVELDELSPSSFDEYFKYVDVWGWSAVLGSSLVNGHPLRWTMYGLWEKYGFFKVYAIEKQKFFNFADRLERSYGKVNCVESKLS